MLTVVSTETCPWCVKVKSLLKMHNIPFSEWLPEQPVLRETLTSHGVSTVPQVFQGDPRCEPRDDVVRIGGYEDTFAWILNQY